MGQGEGKDEVGLCTSSGFIVLKYPYMTRHRGEQELLNSGWEKLSHCHLHEAILFHYLLFPLP